MSSKWRYEVLELGQPLRGGTAYGLTCKEKQDMGWAVRAVAAPFSGDKAAISKLAEKCTQVQLPPEELMEAICEFMDAERA